MQGAERGGEEQEMAEGGAADSEEPLGPEEAGLFRAAAARANYLALDRPEVAFIAQRAASPHERPSEGRSVQA